MADYLPDTQFNLLLNKLKQLKELKEITNLDMIPMVEKLIQKGEVKGGPGFPIAGRLSESHIEKLKQYQEELRQPPKTWYQKLMFWK